MSSPGHKTLSLKCGSQGSDGTSGGLVQVIKSTNYVRQIWRDFNGYEVWERYKVTSTWNAWVRTYVAGFDLAEAAGYQKLPSGLIMQWGFYSGGAVNPITINFPILFPTACLNVQLTSSGAAAQILVAGTRTASSVIVRRWTDAGVEATGNFFWSALGY